MTAVAKRKKVDPAEAAREQIMRWREGGPALFAHEALGIPREWDAETKRGIQPWQWEASRLLVAKRRLSIRSGHGVGKSALLSWTILWFLSCYFPCKVPCTAPSAHQLSDVLWSELAKWHRVLEERMPELGRQFEWTTDEFRMRSAPKESFAAARTARAEKPEALQGFHSENLLIMADEASGVPDIIYEVGQGALSTPGAFAILTSNPTRLSGFFFDTHHKLRERWATMAVSGEDSPLVGKQFREDIAHQYGRLSSVYAVRVLGEFPNSEDDVVIPLDLAESAKIRSVEPFGTIVWGVDVARFGVDRTTLVKRCDNATLEKHKAWGGVDTMQTAGRIYAEWIETQVDMRPITILVDVIGVGAGVCDRLQELGLPVVGVNVGESASISDMYVRLRDELWFNARKWFEKKHCSLAEDETLIAELTLPKYKFTSNGKLQVESKDELKKRYPQSPDVADAFCLTFASAAITNGPKSRDPEWHEDF